LVIDTWEGQLEIDEAVLKANGVAGMGIRINDMNGGHHEDAGFAKQWAEAANFVRFPYFVYNPWVDGRANYDWLNAHMPAGCMAVAIDIEVRMSGYSPATYAGEVVKFLDLCDMKGWKTIIYTAQWFLANLKSWPRVDYWWAQYPDPVKYFSGISTWDDLKLRLDHPVLLRPFNIESCPGNVKMWQFGGDFLTLPGSTRKMDVNLFYGNTDDLAAYFGQESPVVVGEPPVTGEPVTGSGLYVFARAAYWARPNGGPLVTPNYNVTKTSGDKDVVIRQDLIDYLKLTNSAKAYEKIVAPDWGPSKGFNKNGLIINNLIYPGRNLVWILKTMTGIDGEKWGQLESLPVAVPGPEINYKDTPHLVHTVYGSNTKWTWFDLAFAARVPIMGDGPRYVRMEWLEPVDAMLPKAVRVTAFPWINVRELPDVSSVKVGSKLWGANVTIYEVRIAKGGIWGKIDSGWIALRYNDANMTDWKI
jgi:GH25 family lysozyme M1 (1,4-beta-N-acetylmuramidase)